MLCAVRLDDANYASPDSIRFESYLLHNFATQSVVVCLHQLISLDSILSDSITNQWVVGFGVGVCLRRYVCAVRLDHWSTTLSADSIYHHSGWCLCAVLRD